MKRPRRGPGTSTSTDSRPDPPRIEKSKRAGRAVREEEPAARRIDPETMERLRFPGEASAARALRKTRGFGEASRGLLLAEQLRPSTRRTTSEGMRRDEGGEVRSIVDEVAALVGVSGTVEIYQHNGDLRAWVTGEPGITRVHLGGELGMLSAPELRVMLGEALGTWKLHLAEDAPELAAIRVARSWRSFVYTVARDTRAIRSGRLLTACEISADRLALVAAGGLEAYLTAEMKQATSLSKEAMHYEPAVFLAQVREALEESIGETSRAPTQLRRFVRIRAAQLFAASEAFHALTGWGRGEKTLDEVNLEVARLLVGWVPRWSERLPREDFEQFLLAAGGAIAAADGQFAREEQEYLALMLPGVWRGRLLGAEEAARAMEEGAAAIRQLGDTRAQVTTLTFLCGLVDSDGRIFDAELAAIDLVGRALGARELFRDQLQARYEFDPALYTPGTGGTSPRAAAPVGVPLERYLTTVALVGERQVTPRRILRLGGFPRRTPKVVEAVRRALARYGLEAKRLELAALDEHLPIRVRRPPRGG